MNIKLVEIFHKRSLKKELNPNIMLSTKIFTRKICVSNTCGNIKNVTIVGAGQMGSGIAQLCANSGMNVVLTDVRKKSLTSAMSNIKHSLTRVAKKQSGSISKEQIENVALTMERIKTNDNVSTSVADADLVIEAVIENLELKRGLFAQIEQSAKSKTILATNTSSLRLEDIAKGISDKSRFGGLHFFNPVVIMQLLEVVKCSETSEQTFATLIQFGKAVGKTTVACKDSPGFIVNRLLIPYIFESIRLYEREDASMRDIDVAMKLGCGYPMGPFELADYVGLDTLKFSLDAWSKMSPNGGQQFEASPLLDKLVAEGKLGRKTGGGFYSYKK